eukprot:TRINITY_DN150_c0_g2_i1.p1 TRINITY_DN150_c0_g2~~TRINITY_DN150_c0_g2_i1.p1  ORF type:complete len:1108 (+),score=371.60 TRINITY_DN150_c0_g2_i1:80-3325(+)
MPGEADYLQQVGAPALIERLLQDLVAQKPDRDGIARCFKETLERIDPAPAAAAGGSRHADATSASSTLAPAATSPQAPPVAQPAAPGAQPATAEAAPAAAQQQAFDVEILQPQNHPNPILKRWGGDQERRLHYFHEDDRAILVDPARVDGHMRVPPLWLRHAGPREMLHFKPTETTVGIVTCGGLCPGLNDVIRAVVLTCHEMYNVKKVVGFRYGYWGLSRAGKHKTIELTRAAVHGINAQGGSILGTCRGCSENKSEMVDVLMELGVNILFVIGGDGTQRGGSQIYEVIKRRGLDIAVFGIPKTIDNDLMYCHRTFGYHTAVNQATQAIHAAEFEAKSHLYGVGIVKLMGRHSGFIAAKAAISAKNVHICLIPEIPVGLDTIRDLIETRFNRGNTYCVIVVAEGFGEHLMENDAAAGVDASGNKKLPDIGPWLRDKVAEWMKEQPRYAIATVKFIDPSYIIRAMPADADDSAFCVSLGVEAVHEAMHGVTNALVSHWFEASTVVPIALATSQRQCVDPNGKLWKSVRSMTVWRKKEGDAAKAEMLAEREFALPHDMHWGTPSLPPPLPPAGALQSPPGDREKRQFVSKMDKKRLDGGVVRQVDLDVELCAPQNYRSPLVTRWGRTPAEKAAYFHSDETRIMLEPRLDHSATDNSGTSEIPLSLRMAGPREWLHFKPGATTVGIVTCGGLCPGLNDVVRAITVTAVDMYKVKRVIGFRYGYFGLTHTGKSLAVELTRGSSFDRRSGCALGVAEDGRPLLNVHNINAEGGTILGTSRAKQDYYEMVEVLEELGINVLITVGGDGTQRGAGHIHEVIKERGLDISVLGVPKTIDNDLSFCHRTFGFHTAVNHATAAIRAAEFEAKSHRYGIGLVKLMGRHSGFIAAKAAISAKNVHVCLIPEVPLDFDTITELIELRFSQGHSYCVILVAEGFGEHLMGRVRKPKNAADGYLERQKPLGDIGKWLAGRLTEWQKGNPKYAISAVKYIDPSYMIRAMPADADDSAFCVELGIAAIHEAMAGATNAIVSHWYNSPTVVPIPVACTEPQKVDPAGKLWKSVREMTVSRHWAPEYFKKKDGVVSPHI